MRLGQIRARIGSYIRQQHLALLAMFIILTGGTALALPGRNTVDSGDIVNGQVKTPDVATNTVTTAKIRNGHVRGADVLDGGIGRADLAADSVDSSKVASNSLAGSDVAENSLSGNDITESTLGQVPSALLGGLGRTSPRPPGLFGSPCDPESTTFLTCATIGLTLPAQTRVLLIGNVNANAESDADTGFGTCRLGTSRTGSLAETQLQVDVGDDSGDLGNVTLLGVTPVLGPGPVSFGVDCNQLSPGAITYSGGAITALAISPS